MDELHKDRVFVRKVLIERSDRDPGVVRDAVRGACRVAMIGEDTSSSVKDARPSLSRSALFCLLAGLKRLRSGQ